MTALSRGRLVLIVGPSGAGKDTLIAAARARFINDSRFAFVRRFVSRPPSESEDNLHLDAEHMKQLANDGSFALHWQAHGHCYGIPWAIEKTLAQGALAIVNVSRTAVATARLRYPTTVIQIEASAQVLADRLAARGRASDGNLTERLARATATTCEPDILFANELALPKSIAAFCEILESLASKHSSTIASSCA